MEWLNFSPTAFSGRQCFCRQRGASIYSQASQTPFLVLLHTAPMQTYPYWPCGPSNVHTSHAMRAPPCMNLTDIGTSHKHPIRHTSQHAKHMPKGQAASSTSTNIYFISVPSSINHTQRSSARLPCRTSMWYLQMTLSRSFN